MNTCQQLKVESLAKANVSFINETSTRRFKQSVDKIISLSYCPITFKKLHIFEKPPVSQTHIPHYPMDEISYVSQSCLCNLPKSKGHSIKSTP